MKSRQPTRCDRGHLLEPGNIYQQRNGLRRCRICRRAYARGEAPPDLWPQILADLYEALPLMPTVREFTAGKFRYQPTDRELVRFWEKIDVRSIDECWPWKAATTVGYGRHSMPPVGDESQSGKPGPLMAHRVTYELCVGPIAKGLHIDHLCRNPICVNPRHLEPVTPRENAKRGPSTMVAINSAKTECHRGHPLVGSNLRIYGGRRHCRECATLNSRRYRAVKPRPPYAESTGADGRHGSDREYVIGSGDRVDPAGARMMLSRSHDGLRISISGLHGKVTVEVEESRGRS